MILEVLLPFYNMSLVDDGADQLASVDAYAFAI